MQNTSKFWSVKSMNTGFFYYYIYDRFIQRQLRACVRELFLKKTSPQKLLTEFSPNFTAMYLR